MSESVQWSLLLPVVLLAVLGLIQTGLWLHARDIAAAAALAGAEAEALADAPHGTGLQVAERVALASGLREVRVRTSGGPHEVRVEVSGRADGFLPLGQLTVRAEAVQPREDG